MFMKKTNKNMTCCNSSDNSSLIITNGSYLSHCRVVTTDMAYQCEECGSSFQKLSQLIQHRRTQNHWKKYTCPSCKKTFNRKDNLERHLKKHADENNQHCPECLKVFTREDALDDHLHLKHGWSAAAKRTAETQDGAGMAKRQRLQKSDNPSDFYSIEKISERNIEKFKTSATYYKITVKDLEVRDLSNVVKTLKQLFQSIIDNITSDILPTDLVRISIDNPQLDFPIVLPFIRRTALTVDRLLSEIERVLQSYEQFVLDETFGMELVHVHIPTGSGFKQKACVDISKLLHSKRSVIQIRNKDELCCARALITAMARLESHPQWQNIRSGRHIQQQLALDLHKRAGEPLKKCGLEEVKQFQTVLSNYQIHVLSKEHFNAIIYEGPEGGVPIYLYYHDEHFDVITKMTGFLNRSYFCETCKKGYSNKERHNCNNPCVYCHQLHTEEEETWRYCDKCNRHFKNDICFRKHLENKREGGKCTCDVYFKCKDCNQTVNMNRHKHSHRCHEVYCKTCKGFFDEDHLCYMQPMCDDNSENTDKKKKPKETKYIFFDFECTQDNLLECESGYLPDENNKCIRCRKIWCGSFLHQPNLCVVQKVCSHCIDQRLTCESECSHCGKNELVFTGDQTTQLFCQWLFSEENVGATVICHNFKGYDSYPVLQYLHDNAILPEVITNGTKFMSIKVPVCKIRFIDSLNFIPMALADMPKAFGESELVKGYFPHLMNRKENQQLVLSHLPDIKYYNPDGMKIDKRREFLLWYESHKHDKFDFQQELLRYCRSDVDILRKCSLKFRKLFQEISKKNACVGIDPFEHCITIASACNLVFRTNFLDHESIGIIPPHGYRPEDKQSVLAYQWLAFEAHQKNVYIQHGRNIGEKEIGPYKVDGYRETADGEKIVLEFHGCFWHGCPRCFTETTINPVTEITMGDLYARTMEKKHYIEAQGYTYVAMWECDFKREMAAKPDMRTFVESLDIVSPLEPRDAFYGGRTEGFKLYQEASDTMEIKYYDVTSLYPYVNKTGKVPLGHPHIITENFKDISQYEGLIKCKIVAPRGLYLPVLPAKSNGKLLFSLCRSCADQYDQATCQHSESERAFLGTWVTDEIKMSLRKGYKILAIYEVWHFSEVSQYNPSSKTGGIFTDYVNTFLKIKQEASGWPEWCQSENDKQLYIEKFYDREGILLEYGKIEKNPGLRSLAKLMLNSFWGKFGQRTNLTQTSYVSDTKHFFDFMTSDQQDIKNIRFVNDQAVQIDWAYHADFVEPSCRTNVVIAAYTTAQARIKLYSYLQHLGERALYCDTDSIIFTARPGDWTPPLGDYLGDLTDEVPGNTITHFVTGGPKNYAYKIKCGDKNGSTSFCKVKGITLNFKNSLLINYNTVFDMITGKSDSSVVPVVDMKICRDITNTTLTTRQEGKDYKMVFDKRVIDKDFITYPYGY